jgi:hypothetical protein
MRYDVSQADGFLENLFSNVRADGGFTRAVTVNDAQYLLTFFFQGGVRLSGC